jgi:uroporphyrinogen-III synthase
MSGPLSGRTVIITRPAEDSASLADMLRSEGAEVLDAPAIEIVPVSHTFALDRAVRELAGGDFAWVSFSSPRAVDVVVARLDSLTLGRSIRARVAAVGPATADRARQVGWTVDLLAEPHTTLALAGSFPEGKGRVLLPRADIAPEGLEGRLAAKGWTPVRVDAYRTRVPDSLPAVVAEALQARRAEAVVFTSASTVRGFASMAGVKGIPRAVCIGPVTAEAAREAGFEVVAVAHAHTLQGVVDAVRSALAGAAR